MEEKTTPVSRSYKDEANEGLEILWDTAKEVVDKVLEFKPDVIISLLHSGWAPAKAARMLWQATQSKPFPPVVKTNLGREKFNAYAGSSKTAGDFNFLDKQPDLFRTGHILAWLAKQVGWQAELKEQVQAQLPPDVSPGRILVVDDWIGEGNTFLLAMGLLDIIYPQAESHFVAGKFSWKMGFERLWLERFHPHILEQIELPTSEGGLSERERYAFESQLKRLVPGTVDVTAASCNWSMVTISSPLVLSLSRFLPAEEWLELPLFVEKKIEDYIEARIREYRRGLLDDSSLTSLQKGPKMRQETLILRDLWLNDQGITRRQIIEKYDISPGQASRLLKDMLRRGLLIRQGRGRNARYCLHPDAHSSTYSLTQVQSS